MAVVKISKQGEEVHEGLCFHFNSSSKSLGRKAEGGLVWFERCQMFDWDN